MDKCKYSFESDAVVKTRGLLDQRHDRVKRTVVLALVEESMGLPSVAGGPRSIVWVILLISVVILLSAIDVVVPSISCVVYQQFFTFFVARSLLATVGSFSQTICCTSD